MTGPAAAWMPWHIADYDRDTGHLSYDQHGPYLKLLGAAWTRGGFLPNDPVQLANLAGHVPPRAWSKMAPVILAFFQADERGLFQKRLLRELEKAERLAEHSRANGNKGGRPPKPRENPAETQRVIVGFPGKANEKTQTKPSG